MPSMMSSIRSVNGIRIAFAALLGTIAGCSFVLDNEKTQCAVDSDCAEFAGYPLCQAGVCVPSGLGPEGCFLGTPDTQSEYLNACSTSKCVPFDNCDRLGLCGGMELPPTTPPSTARSPTLVNPVTEPMNLCSDGINPQNVIYLYGSADFGPLLRAAQPSLSALSPPYRAVFQGATSCQGVDAIYGTTQLMRDPANPANGGFAFYFNEAREQVNCRVDPVGTSVGKSPDIGISNLYAQTCGRPAATNVAEYLGPVVPFVLSVPAGSGEDSISAEALHFIFGRGGKAPVGMKDAEPWTNWNNYFIRNSNAGSTVLTALLADVPKAEFWGVDRLSTENLRDALLTSNAADSSIGILSIDFNDKYRGNLKALYLQSRGQNCGYQPDAEPTSFDKANVRDGHYPLWGYVHLFTRVLSGGEPSPQAKAMVLLFSLQKLEQRLLDEIIGASLVPQCAMSVSRTTEVGDYVGKGGFQCGCYFDFKANGRTSCQSCTIPSDCPSSAPACNYGYCEKS
jgi:hypothetical protein